MIDFHSHILPKMDDGSNSSEMTKQMLMESKVQGIDIIAATPHFYAHQNSPEEFILRREHAWKRIQSLLNPETTPKVILGAEVQYFEGICNTSQLDLLKLHGTNLLLLEMPFCPWTHMMVQDVITLQRRHDIQIIMAHIERYKHFAPKDAWDMLRAHGVLMQSNAERFLNWKTRRAAMKSLENGDIDLLGSDAHNTSNRRQCLGEAVIAIKKHLGEEIINEIEGLGKSLLGTDR